MIIGVDLDGTIMGRSCDLSYLKVSPKIARFFLRGQASRPNRRMIERLHRYRESGNLIFVITARREELRGFSEKQLEKCGVPFDRVFCVGNGPGAWKRKLEKAKALRVELFFDDNTGVVQAMKRHGINAVHVTSGGFFSP